MPIELMTDEQAGPYGTRRGVGESGSQRHRIRTALRQGSNKRGSPATLRPSRDRRFRTNRYRSDAVPEIAQSASACSAAISGLLGPIRSNHSPVVSVACMVDAAFRDVDTALDHLSIALGFKRA